MRAGTQFTDFIPIEYDLMDFLISAHIQKSPINFA